jgi:hypothetical protein
MNCQRAPTAPFERALLEDSDSVTRESVSADGAGTCAARRRPMTRMECDCVSHGC